MSVYCHLDFRTREELVKGRTAPWPGLKMGNPRTGKSMTK